MKVLDIMSSPVHVMAPEETVAHVRREMLKRDMSRFPVIEDSSLAGMITKKDIGHFLHQNEPLWKRRPADLIPVRGAMSVDTVCTLLDTEVHDVAAQMVRRKISGLPVMDENSIVGIVTKHDFLLSDAVKNPEMCAFELAREIPTVSRYHSLNHVIDIMRRQNNKVVVVNNDGSLAGIITETNLAFFTSRDENSGLPEKGVKYLKKEVSAGKKLYRHVREVASVAEDLMTHPVITAPASLQIKKIVHLMLIHSVNSIVLMEEDMPWGIITRDDIIQEVAK